MTRPGSKTTVIVDPAEPTIVISRWFDAPPHLVFEATSRPELIKRWWGLRVSQMIVCEVEHRVGGRWRFVLRSPDGREDGFRGVYKEIVPDLRVVQTFIYDPFPDMEALETVSFAPERGGTRIDIVVRHQSMAARDGHVQSGMEAGMSETHGRLDELLASLRATA